MPPQAEGPPQVTMGAQVWIWTVTGQIWQADTAVMGAAAAAAGGGQPAQVWMPPQTEGPPAVTAPPEKSWVKGPCMYVVKGFTVHPLWMEHFPGCEEGRDAGRRTSRRRAGRALRIQSSPGKEWRHTRIRLGSPSHRWLERTPQSIRLVLQYIYEFLFFIDPGNTIAEPWRRDSFGAPLAQLCRSSARREEVSLQPAGECCSFGRPSLSQPSLSRPPPRPDGRERAPEPIFERISPSSPVRSGGRMGEEGWGDEGQRTEDAKADKRIIRSSPPTPAPRSPATRVPPGGSGTARRNAARDRAGGSPARAPPRRSRAAPWHGPDTSRTPPRRAGSPASASPSRRSGPRPGRSSGSASAAGRSGRSAAPATRRPAAGSAACCT